MGFSGGFLYLKKAIQEVHVDWRVGRWSTGRHVDHLCGWQIAPWPARKVTDLRTLRMSVLLYDPLGMLMQDIATTQTICEKMRLDP